MVVASCSNLGGKLLTLTERSHWPLSVAIFLFIQWLPTQPWTPILCLIITEFSSQCVAFNFLIHLSENDILILIKEFDKSLKPMVIMHMNDREAGTLMDIRAILLELECALAFQKGLWKCQWVGPTNSVVTGWVLESAFLTSPQVMLMLLVQALHFENHCSTTCRLR